MKKEDIKNGFWYFIISYEFPDIWFVAKVIHIEDLNVFADMHYSNFKKSFNKGGGNFSISNVKRLASIFEIKKYVPKEYWPDFRPSFKVGDFICVNNEKAEVVGEHSDSPIVKLSNGTIKVIDGEYKTYQKKDKSTFTGYINVYEKNIGGGVWKTREEAELVRDHGYVKTIKITVNNKK